MSTACRIALAALRFASSPDESVGLAGDAIAEAGAAGADVVRFGECYVPGYRAPGKRIPPPDPEFLADAWSALSARAAEANIVVILGTERVVDGAVRIASLVIDRDGTVAGV